MAGQSITFDFLSRGAATLSRDFRSVGDDSALASRGVKILSDVIERLGAKADRTAAESKILARALRETGDAADRATAKAVLADAAIRRLGDAEKDAAKKSDDLSKALGGLKLNPGLIGPALALAPAMATLGGVVAGVGVGLAGAFTAGAGALAAFGAVAKPVLTDAKTAATAVEKAQSNYAIAIANGTKQSVAYKAEQIAIARAYAGLSPAQIALSKQLGDMAKAWDAVKTAQTPVVAGALQPWLKSVSDLTKNLAPIIAAVSPVIKGLGGQFDALVNSAAFRGFRDFIAGTGSKVVGAAGGTIIDLVKSFMILLPKFNPLILQMTGGIAAIGPAVLKWASSQKTADDITRFMAWFRTNGPVVGGLLASIAGALKTLAPGLTSGGLTELKVISDFFGLVAKLPPGLAKPLTEVAGSMLILNKLGVVSVGIKLTGLATAGAGAAGGPLAVAGAAIAAGIVFKIREDLKSGFNGIIRDIPKWFSFGSLGFIVQSAQGWADLIVSKVRHSLLSWEDDVRHNIANAFDGIRHDVSATWDSLMSRLLSAWRSVIGTLQNAWRVFVVDGILTPLGWIVTGAAKAFGWVPGLGPKLQAAARQFETFKNNVNTALGAINGRTVNVGVAMTSATNPYGGINPKKAAGGLITAGTGPTADDVAILVSRGELIVPAHLVRAGAVDHLRGRLPGFASGGPVGVNVQATAPGYAAIESSLLASVMKLAVVFAKAAQAAAAAAAGGGAGTPGPGGGAPAANAALARRMMPSWGSGAEWAAWNTLMMHESGWNQYARNPSSGAYGIPQALPPGKMGAAANPPQSNPAAQISWMIGYIRSVYGDPIRAWAQYYAHPGGVGYYDRGGWLRPGVTLAVNNTGRPEAVIPGAGLDGLAAELRALRGQMAELIRTTAAVPAATGRHVGGAISGAAADAVFRGRYPGR